MIFQVIQNVRRFHQKAGQQVSVGGGLLLVLNLLLFLFHNEFGITSSLAVRINLASAGVWWGLFSLPSLIYLNTNHATSNFKTMLFLVLYREVQNITATFKDAKNYPMALLFLLAYLFIMMVCNL